jgi:hypothetical protein
MAELTGRCLCGAVLFAISGTPLRIVYCHCESCRRTTSSPATTYLIMQRADVRYTQGTPRSYASSPGVRRSFCARCGSPLAYEADDRPDHIDLFACTLNDPATVAPQAHVYAQEQLPWFEIADNLPRYARLTGGEEPIRHGPSR